MAEYNILGVDIGGTKCAVIYGRESDGELTIVEKVKFPTTGVDETIARIIAETESLMSRHGLTAENTASIGISCGG
ncbi:MAG TPA: ROK family protein, partial [Candidatus Alistipes pullicola]|nr:ROK family protein [Candidatus Alistipes pullicola]